MKITASRKALLAALERCHALSQRATGPAEHTLFQADLARLNVAASNYSQTLRMPVLDSEIGKPGEVCINTKQALDACKAMVGEQVEIDASGIAAKFVSGSGMAGINILPADQFPEVTADDLKRAPFDTDELRKAIPALRHHISSNIDRAHLCGVSIVYQDGEAFAFTSDGQTAMVADLGESAEFEGIIIPTPALDVICDEGGAILLSEAKAACGGLVTALIDSQPINIFRYCPPEDTPEAELDAAALIQAIALAETQAGGDHHGSHIRIELTEKSARVMSGNRRAETTLDAKWSGDPMAWELSSRYLLRCLRSLGIKDGPVTLAGGSINEHAAARVYRDAESPLVFFSRMACAEDIKDKAA